MAPNDFQCAVGPDGALLDASDIVFYNDPDDDQPLPPAPGPALPSSLVAGPLGPNLEGRGHRVKDISRLQAGLLAEKQDDDGLPFFSTRPRAPKSTRRKPAKNIDTDPEDNDYCGSSVSESDSESDSDDGSMENTEITSILLSKTVPLTSAGTSKQLRDKSAKRKASSTTAGAGTSSKRPRATVEEIPDEGLDGVCRSSEGSVVLTEAPPLPSASVSRSASLSSVAPAMDNKKNFIYLFFEKVEADEDGVSAPGDRYYKCWHGSRKIFSVRKSMKYSVRNMVNHLKAKFPSMYQLYTSFSTRGTLPTLFEVQIATGSKEISQDDINKHLADLQVSATSSIQAAFDKQVAATWDQATFENLLSQWIVSCDQPFDQVEHPAFRDLLNYVYTPARKPLNIPGRTTIRKKVMKIGEDTIQAIQKIFSELQSKVAISLDAWTSSNQFAFLAILAHYVSNSGTLEEILIDFQEIVGDHSGENMAEVVWKTIELYGLQNKISSFVMDNATNNDTMLVALETRFRAAGVAFSAKDARGRCMPHTIHLAAISLLEECGAITSTDAQQASIVNYQDVLNEATTSGNDDDGVVSRSEPANELASNDVDTSAIGRLRRIIRTVRSSPQRRQNWLRTVALTHPMVNADGRPHQPLMLILDVKTRWSSTHQMLERAILYEASIRHFVAANHRQLGDHALYDEDWKTIKLVADWLKLFRSATIQMSATKTPMISTTHAIFRGLQDKLKSILNDLPNDVAPGVKLGIVKAHRKLSDYFTKFDESPFYTWAAILDPRITYAELKADYEDDPELLEGLEKSKAALHQHFNNSYPLGQSPTSSQSGNMSTLPLPRRLDPLDSNHFDFTARFRRQPSRPAVSELDEYLCLPPIEFHSCNPIQWWHSNRHRFPRLHLLALDILAIPGSAVAVERVFSGGRDTISIRRASLRPDTIRILMIVKQRARVHL